MVQVIGRIKSGVYEYVQLAYGLPRFDIHRLVCQ